MEVKKALLDARFRDKLPIFLREDIAAFLQDPGCACNIDIYKKIAKECKGLLEEYYPGKEAVDEIKAVEQLSQNHWKVVNCHIDELEKELKKLGPGRKQLDVARWEDQVTIVINELDYIF